MAKAQYTQTENNSWVGIGPSVSALPAGIYKIEDGSVGIEFKLAEIITDDLIEIPDGTASQVYEDMVTFFKSSDAWRRFRLSHKRGYLLYGPPGTGKSSIAIQMARKIVSDGGLAVIVECVGDLYSAVEQLGEIEPDRKKMFIIEEAEHLVNHRIALSVLDGSLSISNSIFVATTNHIENLPARIINRPGRFAHVRLIDRPDAKVQRLYLQNIVDRVSGDEYRLAVAAMERVLEHIGSLPGIALDHLREGFACHYIMGDDIKIVTDRIKEMLPTIEKATTGDRESDTSEDSDGEVLK